MSVSSGLIAMQRTVEQRGGVAADGLAMTGGLALQGGDIAHRALNPDLQGNG
jgi:hypothetical protein